jgi:hypothetical protein
VSEKSAYDKLLDRLFEAIDGARDIDYDDVLSALIAGMVRELSCISCPCCRASAIKEMREVLPRALRDAERFGAENDAERGEELGQECDGERILN